MVGDQNKELEKRQQIFRAAEPIFIRFGYHKTTVEEVCRATRISKRTFYGLFTDKFDLLMQMHAQLAQDLTDLFNERVQDETSAAAGIRLYLDLFFQITEERPLFRVLLEEGDLMKRMIEVGSTDEQFSSVIYLLSDVIQKGITNGEFRPMDPMTITWVIQSMLDSIHLFLMDNAAATQMLDLTLFVEETKTFIVNGLLVNRA
jgi:AcrR family transcriptional regulator